VSDYLWKEKLDDKEWTSDMAFLWMCHFAWNLVTRG